MTDRPILVVLDTSAVRAYADGSVDVGEVMTEVADEYGLVAVPWTAAGRSSRSDPERQRSGRQNHLVSRYQAVAIATSRAENAPPRMAIRAMGASQTSTERRRSRAASRSSAVCRWRCLKSSQARR